MFFPDSPIRFPERNRIHAFLFHQGIVVSVRHMGHRPETGRGQFLFLPAIFNSPCVCLLADNCVEVTTGIGDLLFILLNFRCDWLDRLWKDGLLLDSTTMMGYRNPDDTFHRRAYADRQRTNHRIGPSTDMLSGNQQAQAVPFAYGSVPLHGIERQNIGLHKPVSHHVFHGLSSLSFKRFSKQGRKCPGTFPCRGSSVIQQAWSFRDSGGYAQPDPHAGTPGSWSDRRCAQSQRPNCRLHQNVLPQPTDD